MKRGNFISCKNKKGQVTIYIIVAIVIVAVLIVFLFPQVKRIFVPSKPEMMFQGCVDDSRLKEAIDTIGSQGGSVDPSLALMYQGNKIEYLCYTNQYYKTCVMQQPLLKQHVEREIYDYIKQNVKSCIVKTKQDLIKKGYSVSGSDDTEMKIMPDKIRFELKELTVSRETEEGAERYSGFKMDYKTKLYDLIMLSGSILNWEARYGDSDITTYMIYYPNIKVEKYKQSDGSKIYILTHRVTEDKFRFATRSLSWPAGYDIAEVHTPVGASF